MALNTKVMVAAIAAIIIVVAVAAFVLLGNGNGGSDDTDDDKFVNASQDGYSRLAIVGNADMDDVLDNADVAFLKKVINGEAEPNRYCDMNADGRIDNKDLDLLKDLIAGKATSLGYINVKDERCKVAVPIKNVAIGFRRTSEMVGFLAGSDIIKAMTEGTKAQFYYVGFTDEAKANIINPGQNNDGNVTRESLLEVYKKFQNNGGLTIFGDSNGMVKEMEDCAAGLMDVVRLPCTEGDRIAEGMVTLGYMLAYNSPDAKAIKDRTSYWLDLNDSTDAKITAAVSKIAEKDRVPGIIVLNNLSTATEGAFKIRGVGLSEYEFTVKCGCNNYAGGNYVEGQYANLDNEIILSMQRDGMTTIVVEVQTLFQKIGKAYDSATTAEEKAAALRTIEKGAVVATTDDTMKGYTGSFYFVGQETCNGPESIFLKMYLASLFVPELKNVYTLDNINSQFKEYMKMLNPDSILVDAELFYSYD
ncbi:MAG: hypothetical protein MJZ68_05375 [archaeon]|nr:hypothetical protein [archaeon]